MNRWKLLLRNLWYFRGVNLAVLAGMAVATAVLTGALMVGDSVRGSLADLAIRRLGAVDYALISTRFFDQSLADRLGPNVTAGIIIRGGATDDSSTADVKPRMADVQIAALASAVAGTPNDVESVGSAVRTFTPPAGKSDDRAATQSVRAADRPPRLPVEKGMTVINSELARGLSGSSTDAAGAEVKAGTTLVYSVATQSDSPRDSALSRRGRNDVLNQLRADVAGVASMEDFVSLFSPGGSQRVPRNAWVNLADLQDAIDQPGRVNALLAHAADAKEEPAAAVEALNEKIRQVARLSDYGLSLTPVGDDEVSIFARETYIAAPVISSAVDAAKSLNVRLRQVSVNLINSLTKVERSPSDTRPAIGATLHYLVAAGISTLDDGALADSEIALNQWTADRLGVKVGDAVRLDFSRRQAGGDLADASKVLPADQLTFTVKVVLPMSGLGTESRLPPNYKGLTDTDSVADWDPPEGLKIDKKLVTPADEDYWKKYHAAPKLFVSFDTARKLWGGVYGDVTGLRVPSKDADAFGSELLKRIKPESMGLVFRPIKAEQLASAAGGTDFSMFFIMFSFFLIVAAALLVAMLCRLNVEQRARQLGLMSAVGFSPAALRLLALREGMALAAVGGAIGLVGAVGYTSLIMLGLRTWWVGAVGTTSMTLHVEPLTLIYGWAGSLFVAFFAILWAIWRIGRAQSARLLAGGFGFEIRPPGEGWIARSIAVICTVGGLAIVGLALGQKISPEAGFGGGAMVLCGGLAWLVGALRPRRHDGARFVGFASLVRLGLQNANRHTARGVLSVGLIAFAAFTLITVAALKQDGVGDPGKKNSETGGYRLILSAGIPLTGDLNTSDGRHLLGIRKPADPIFSRAHFTPLRQWAGQDISCLNLTKPTSPTVLGVPREMTERGGFIPGDALSKTANPWTLLNSDQAGEIPVMADSDTQEYVLQIEMGGTISITDQIGVPRKLKLVATIAHSIFQGQLLMSDANFRKLFPAQSGFGMEVVECPAADAFGLQQVLNTELGDYSVVVDQTPDRVKTYLQVQNTYLETFQTLGALGLMLGTLGLAVVLVRTVIERKGELALLASLGFTSTARVMLALSENAFLLIAGLLIGSASAVIGILPAVVRESRPINAISLAGTLAAVILIGLISSIVAVGLSGVHVKPADLRSE
jgi:putative ABC transport system permease protein